MAEIAVRKIPIKPIQNEEDWKKNRDALQYYLDEYHWFISHDTEEARVADTSKKLDDYTERLENAEKGSDAYKKLRSDIHALRVKFQHMRRGTYDVLLRKNIRAEMIMLDEYDTREHKIPFREVVRGVLKGDSKAKEYVKKKLVFILNNSYGIEEQPQSLLLEPNPYDEFIHEYHDSFVDTNSVEEKETRRKGLGNIC